MEMGSAGFADVAAVTHQIAGFYRLPVFHHNGVHMPVGGAESVGMVDVQTTVHRPGACISVVVFVHHRAGRRRIDGHTGAGLVIDTVMPAITAHTQRAGGKTGSGDRLPVKTQDTVIKHAGNRVIKKAVHRDIAAFYLLERQLQKWLDTGDCVRIRFLFFN